MKNIELTYLGHACFTITKDDYSIILDPYKGVRGFKDIEGTYNEVLCSHDHFDHCYKEKIKIISKPSSFCISFVDSYHDDVKGEKRGTNKITIIDSSDKRIVHLGDLGHLLDLDTINKLGKVDVLLVPIGGTYTIDSDFALKIINDINPELIVPMHYKDGDLGLEVLEDIEIFINKAKDYQDKLRLIRAYFKSIII